MIKNILFDFGNVLIDLDTSATQNALLNIKGLDTQKLDRLFNIDHYNDRYEKGELYEESFFNAIQRCYDPVPEIYDLFNAWNAMLIGIPPKRLNKLLELRNTYKTFLFSNINDTHLRWIHFHLKTQHQIDDFESRFFDKVYYSHNLGHRKPDPEGFLFILQDSGIKAEETLFIDDLLINTQVASDLGYQVHHHNPDEEIFDVLPKLLNIYP